MRAHGVNCAKGHNSRSTGVIHKWENIYKSQGPTSSICAAGGGCLLTGIGRSGKSFEEGKHHQQ